MLLSGEYAVLDGATAIALPTKLGQKMVVKPTRGSDLIWKSYDKDGEIWFDANISLYDFKAVKTKDESKMPLITKLLKSSVRLNSEFLDKWNGFKIENFLEFPLEWGLGSSSTLLANVAGWADINPFLLHFRVSNGSGYDIACAAADGPIQYTSSDDEISYTPVDFNPSFKEHLHFVHLGKKQDSAIAVEQYLKGPKRPKDFVSKISDLGQKMLQSKNLSDFKNLMDDHESTMAEILKQDPVKETKFQDFDGSIKSLGAWGGDMVLVASDLSFEDLKAYFSSKACDTVIKYDDLIL